MKTDALSGPGASRRGFLVRPSGSLRRNGEARSPPGRELLGSSNTQILKQIFE